MKIMGKPKLLTLGLISLLLIVLPFCKKTPTSPDIESVVTPATPSPQIEYFTANATEIEYGESSTLSWSTKNATTVTINQEVVSAEGEKIVSPEETSTYVLTAKNSEGETTKSCTVEVNAPPTPPIIEFFSAAYAETDDPGADIWLSWSTTNTTEVHILRNGHVIHVGESKETWSVGDRLWETTTFELIAYNESWRELVTATITVIIIDRSNVELASYWTSNEPATIYGYVKNTGNIQVCHVYIKFTDDNYGVCETEISGCIMPGEEAHFGAERIPFRWSWTLVHLNMPPEITWELR